MSLLCELYEIKIKAYTFGTHSVYISIKRRRTKFSKDKVSPNCKKKNTRKTVKILQLFGNHYKEKEVSYPARRSTNSNITLLL